jgi:pantoate--beta-alanine ligase
MRTFDQVTALRAYLRAAREDGKVVGFVPTMGALHEGHLTLMRRARGDCDVVVSSVFVNPTQFAAGEDFDKYPRDIQKDSVLAQKAGVDALFAPPVEELYPTGSQTLVDVPDLAAKWEGAIRPGHFRGVATVCAKLFQIVQPNRVYFGQKDYQQLRIIERMVADLHVPLTVVSVPTVRAEDGLALSSRNVYLSEEERKASTVLSRALNAVSQEFQAGQRSGTLLAKTLTDLIQAEPLAILDYAVVVDADTLEPVHNIEKRAAALVAARFGKTRLIDNALLGSVNGKRTENEPAKG